MQWEDDRERVIGAHAVVRQSIPKPRTSNSNPPSIPIQLQTKQANNVSHLPARPKLHHPTPNLPSSRRLKSDKETRLVEFEHEGPKGRRGNGS